MPVKSPRMVTGSSLVALREEQEGTGLQSSERISSGVPRQPPCHAGCEAPAGPRALGVSSWGDL